MTTNTVLKLVPAVTVKLTDLPITEIAARVRGEIKEAQKAGDIPEGKISVKVSKYAGGCSLTIRCLDLAGNMFDVSRLWHQIANPTDFFRSEDYRALPDTTPLCEAVREKLNAIVAPYHMDKSDVMSDYFNCNFYLHVYVQSGEQCAAERARLVAAWEKNKAQ